MRRHKSQFSFKDRNGAFIISTDTNIKTTSRQQSPQSPDILTCSTAKHAVLPVKQNAIYQAKIKELLEENLKLMQKNSAQDKIISTLKQKDQDDPTRSCRVNTLTNLGIEKIKQLKIGKPKLTQENTPRDSKDEKMMFTFFSPDSRTKPTFKLPKVFQIMPQKKKFFV